MPQHRRLQEGHRRRPQIGTEFITNKYNFRPIKFKQNIFVIISITYSVMIFFCLQYTDQKYTANGVLRIN